MLTSLKYGHLALSYGHAPEVALLRLFQVGRPAPRGIRCIALVLEFYMRRRVIETTIEPISGLGTTAHADVPVSPFSVAKVGIADVPRSEPARRLRAPISVI